MLCVLAVFQVDSRGQVENWSKIRFCLLVDPAWRKSQSVNLASFFSPKYSWVRPSKKLFMAYWGQLSLGESRLKPSWPAMRSSRNYEWDTNTDSQEEDLNDDCPPHTVLFGFLRKHQSHPGKAPCFHVSSVFRGNFVATP